MTVRLRSAPPRRRRAAPPAPLIGVAAVALLVTVWFTLSHRGREAPRVRIEPLPAAALQQRPVTGAGPPGDDALVSLPPLAPPQPFLADHRIVSFYGNPLAEVLGVLGEQGPEQMVARLRAQAGAYQQLSPDRTVVPAMHLIYAVAQSRPGNDGTHLLRMDDALVQQYIRVTRDNGMLLFLDIQMGRSTVEAELPHIFEYLKYDNVHAALDPEFAWGKEGVPNDDIGSLDGAQINRAQRMLQRFTMEQRLPSKILVVHQFLPGMVKNKASVRSYDRVELVYDADGFGMRAVKLDAWSRVITDENVQLAGIKLFYKHDPDLMSPAEVLSLNPKPAIIIYQ